VLEKIPETVWTLKGTAIAGYQTAVKDEETAEQPAETVGEPAAAEAAPATLPSESAVIASDDGGTEMVFNPDGTYVFKFAAYNIEEAGTFTFESGTLRVVNANGAEATAEGDPLKLHYVSAVNEQLAGDYTIPADALTFGAVNATATTETSTLSLHDALPI
jgi:hypothetical protein